MHQYLTIIIKIFKIKSGQQFKIHTLLGTFVFLPEVTIKYKRQYKITDKGE